MYTLINKHPILLLLLLVVFTGGCAEIPSTTGTGTTGDSEEEIEVTTVVEEVTPPRSQQVVEVDTMRDTDDIIQTPLEIAETMIKGEDIPPSNRWILPDDARNTINPAQQKYFSDVVHRRGQRSHTAPIYNMGNHASIFTIKF